MTQTACQPSASTCKKCKTCPLLGGIAAPRSEAALRAALEAARSAATSNWRPPQVTISAQPGL